LVGEVVGERERSNVLFVFDYEREEDSAASILNTTC